MVKLRNGNDLSMVHIVACFCRRLLGMDFRHSMDDTDFDSRGYEGFVHIRLSRIIRITMDIPIWSDVTCRCAHLG